MKKVGPIPKSHRKLFSRFDTASATNRGTDGQTDR